MSWISTDRSISPTTARNHPKAAPVKATGATAGIPGTFTPAGCETPATQAEIFGLVATPQTGWTTGQFVQSLTPGSAGRATWTGTSWVGGIAP